MATEQGQSVFADGTQCQGLGTQLDALPANSGHHDLKLHKH